MNTYVNPTGEKYVYGTPPESWNVGYEALSFYLRTTNSWCTIAWMVTLEPGYMGEYLGSTNAFGAGVSDAVNLQPYSGTWCITGGPEGFSMFNTTGAEGATVECISNGECVTTYKSTGGASYTGALLVKTGLRFSVTVVGMNLVESDDTQIVTLPYYSVSDIYIGTGNWPYWTKHVVTSELVISNKTYIRTDVGYAGRTQLREV